MSWLCAARTSGLTAPCWKPGSTSGELEDYPSNTIPGFLRAPVGVAADADRAPLQPRCARRLSAAPARRHLAGHILEHVTLELQNLAGLPGGFGKARETATRGVYKVVVRAWQEDVTRAALARGARPGHGRHRRPPLRRARAPSTACAAWSDRYCLGAQHRLHRRTRPTTATSPTSAWSTATWCRWDTARASAASGRPKPTAPAPSPKASRATRT